MPALIKSLSTIFLLAVILVLAVWLFMDKCNRGKPTLSGKIDAGASLLKEQSRLRDSVFKAQVKKDQLYKADSIRWKRMNDSVTSQLTITRKELNKKQSSTNGLVADVNDAYNKKDSSRFIRKCLELGDSVTTLNATVDRLEYQVDTLTAAKDSLQLVTQQRLEEKDKALTYLKKSIDASDATIVGLQSDLKKAAKKADKKYAVGLGVTGGITTMGTPGGAVGVSVIRTIFRF